jgi:A/G-specific adenine glycosylase
VSGDQPDPARFAPALLAWFAAHGRRDLPWQRQRTPYRVWVSEIMLQQTQVGVVIPYYERFMRHFPAIRALADAPLDAVLHLWSGLGYYARARNLHRAAQRVRDAHGGVFPREFGAVVALPGVGRSTAGAILALAHDERYAILDGNVKRVLARWFGVAQPPGAALVARLWELSEAVTPATHAADFTQAVMDLGATLCTRAQPACGRCPVAAGCVARRSGRQQVLPAPRPRKARPRRSVCWLVLRRDAAVLLEQRAPAGLWGGLWGFPEFATRAEAAGFAARVLARPATVALRPRARIRHAFTHFELDIRPFVVDCDAAQSATIMESDRWTWYNSRAPRELGLAAPVASLIAQLRETA